MSGLLWPGFSKRVGDAHGTTYLWGIPIGRFDVIELDGDERHLRYRRWPITDVLHGNDGTGNLRLPHDRLVRFCRFRLES